MAPSLGCGVLLDSRLARAGARSLDSGGPGFEFLLCPWVCSLSAPACFLICTWGSGQEDCENRCLGVSNTLELLSDTQSPRRGRLGAALPPRPSVWVEASWGPSCAAVRTLGGAIGTFLPRLPLEQALLASPVQTGKLALGGDLPAPTNVFVSTAGRNEVP